jgi:hypothetical protein
LHVTDFEFFPSSIYLQSVEIHSDTFSKWCVGKQNEREVRLKTNVILNYVKR